jgi:hypothetical protein
MKQPIEIVARTRDIEPQVYNAIMGAVIEVFQLAVTLRR